MQAAPIASIHHCSVRTTIAMPTAAASAKKTSAITSTVRGVTRPDAVRRAGPTRTASVPRMPSL